MSDASLSADHAQDAELRRLQLALDEHALVSIADPQGRIIFANDKFCAVSKYSREELLGADHRIVNSRQHPPEFFRQLWETISSGKTWKGEICNRAKDGSLYWVSSTIVPFLNAEGRPYQYVAIRTDITERKRTEESLRNSLLSVKNLEMALDEHALVSIADPQGKIIFANDKFCAVSQYSREELLGADHRIVNSHHHPPEFFRQLWASLSSGNAWKGDICNRAKDGSLYWVSSTIVPFLNDEGRPYQYVAIRKDITERKLIEQKLEAALAAKSDFLATMSHEIRTPMNGVIGMAGILVKTRLDPEQRECAETIRSCGESLLTLINDILDYSKIEAGKLELEQTQFSLQMLLDEILALFSDSAEKKGLSLTYSVPQSLPSQLVGDPVRVRQILINLVGNALKFTERGGIEVRIGIDEICNSRAILDIAVIDTGLGMSPEQVQRIGQAFVQADSSTTRRYGGTGLGLSISKHLITAMNGELQISSKPGVGSTFRVKLSLPVGVEADDIYHTLAGKRLCAAIADSPLRLQMSQLAQRWNLQFRCFADALSLMQALRAPEEKTDLIFVDQHLPGIDGPMLCSLIQRDPALSQLPLIYSCDEGHQDNPDIKAAVVLRRQALRPGVLLEGLGRIFRPAAEAKLKAAINPIPRLGRILVAEDNAVNQRVIRRFLESFADNIDMAVNGQEALQLFRSTRYDCIFMDCQMPEMDGFEATRIIRIHEHKTQAPPVIIVALTANALSGDRERCLAAGMSEYLSKPLRFDDLKAFFARVFPGGGSVSPDRLDQFFAAEDIREIRLLALETFESESLKAAEAFNGQNFKWLGQAVHNVKSVAATFNFDRLAEVSQSLDAAARAGDHPGIDEIYPLWHASLGEAIAELKS